LHSFLTSSHHTSIRPKPDRRMYGVFKRPHLSASRWTFSVHRQSAAACVSLSKSTMSKTRTPLPRGPSFSARCRRRRLSIQPRIPCQTVFYKTVRTDPTKPPKGEPSRPWRPSREERQPSQVRISKKLFLDLKDQASNSCELFTKPSGAAPSKESQTPCQSRISLNFSRTSRPNTSPNLGILIELFAPVRSGASIEASPQSQSPRFSIFSKGQSRNEETKRDPWAAKAARLDPLPSRLERGS